MNKIQSMGVLVIKLCLTMCAGIYISFLPNSSNSQVIVEVEKALKSRDSRLNKLEYKWERQSTRHMPGMTKPELTKLLLDSEQQVRFDAMKSGVSDPKKISQLIEESKEMAEHIAISGNFDSKSNYIFTRNGIRTGVVGTIIDEQSKITSVIHEYYDEGSVIYCTVSCNLGERKIVAPPTTVYSAQGNGVENSVGPGDTLGLRPADFILLCNTNPLASYGGLWHKSSTEAHLISYSTEYTNDKFGPYNIIIKLDSDHNFAPSKIEVKRGKEVYNYSVLNYSIINGIYIPQIVQMKFSYGEMTTERVWKLIKTQPSKPIKVDVGKQKRLFYDIRLSGPATSEKQAHDFFQLSNLDIVQYKWNGKLPTLVELKQMRGKSVFTLPGAKRDIVGGPSRLLMFVPGVLLIGAGIFLKLRKSRKEKESALPAPKK